LNEIEYTTDEHLAVIHSNIRSLGDNFDKVCVLSSELKQKFDVTCFTESWLTDSTKSLYTFENYQSFNSLPHNNKRGGGVSVYVRDTFKVENLLPISVSLPTIESLFPKICCESKQITVGTIYKPPSANSTDFTDSLEQFIVQVNRVNFSEIILCGDFN
jgi:exonuclease III